MIHNGSWSWVRCNTHSIIYGCVWEGDKVSNSEEIILRVKMRITFSLKVCDKYLSIQAQHILKNVLQWKWEVNEESVNSWKRGVLEVSH